MEMRFRPLEREFTTAPGWGNRFRASYDDTLRLLDDELRHLGAEGVVIQPAVQEADLRLDGMVRANTNPRHPGVALSFESKHGALVYRTNAYSAWQANLRAIALGLESLRRVDRYGITAKGEQYAGWKALPAGGDQERAQRGRQLIAQHGSIRNAQRATHPDRGGSGDDFAAVQAAIEAGAE